MPPKKEDASDVERELLGLGDEPVEAKPATAEEIRLHPTLSNEEVLEARKRAIERYEADQRKNALRQVEEAELRTLRGRGSPSGDPVQDEMVTFTLDLAPHSDRIILDGVIYMHGQTYTVPRRIANVLAEQQWRGWEHQDQIDGKDRLQHYAAQRNTRISEATRVVHNAPQQTGGAMRAA